MNAESVLPQKRKADDADSKSDKGAQSRVDFSKESRWNAQWRAPQTKKHKTWDGDAIVGITPGVNGSFCTLYDDKGNVLFRQVIPSENLKEGDFFRMAEKEFQLDYPLSPESVVHRTAIVPISRPKVSSRKVASKPLLTIKANVPKTIPDSPLSESAKPSGLYASDVGKTKEGRWEVNMRKSSSSKNAPWQEDGFLEIKGTTFRLFSEHMKLYIADYAQAHGTNLGRTLISKYMSQIDKVVALYGGAGLPCAIDDDPIEAAVETRRNTPPPQAPPVQKFVPPTLRIAAPPKKINTNSRHDPEAEGAIVMKSPNTLHQAKHNKNLPVVPVVIDPILCKNLRPHQKEGMKFMYECVMGMKRHEGYGCILADEMGLGKTLQTIALIWTLLKQSPYAGAPVIGKCLVVCPVSLINNWKNEFHKWIGKDRIGIFVGDKDKATIKQFTNSRIHHVLIIGYERLKGVIHELAYCHPPIGLIVCDEGHRLKSSQSKVNQMFAALRTPRRIILSGTPIQNNLEELHAMSDFCNPGLLGITNHILRFYVADLDEDDYSTFKRLYESPIVKSRTPGCSKKELELGNTRLTQLLGICESFVLRRDASLLSNYLPPKFEYVVFVKPTQLQNSIFNIFLHQNSLNSLISGSIAKSLALITKLMKISNSPALLGSKDIDYDEDEKGDAESHNDLPGEATKLLPRNVDPIDITLSGKLNALSDVLRVLRQETEEKCIIVSQFITTLDIIQRLCEKRRYTCNRLDGQTNSAKRQELVDHFNKSSQRDCFVFLLSTKAGGVGLNLIGASRLVLFDSGWNPSNDLQAMARIHRDGQKRPVYIYRLLTAGTIDEKIYQRQVTKMGLSHALMANNSDPKSKSSLDSFTPQELRDLFTFHASTPCHTHELLECACQNASAGLNTNGEDLNSTSELEDEFEGGWTIASQLNTDKVNQKFIKQKKVELATLTSEWSHTNCLIPLGHERIQDDILKSVISDNKAEKCLTGGLESVSNLSRTEHLLAAMDAWCDQLVEEEQGKYLDTSDLQGGFITYVFEKKSN